MLCPYFGNGKRDTRRLKDFIEVLKERETDEVNEKEELFSS